MIISLPSQSTFLLSQGGHWEADTGLPALLLPDTVVRTCCFFFRIWLKRRLQNCRKELPLFALDPEGPSALLSLCRDVSLPTEKPGNVCGGRWTDHVGDTVLLHQTKGVASQHWPTSGKGKLRNKERNWVCSTVSRGTVSRPSRDLSPAHNPCHLSVPRMAWWAAAASGAGGSAFSRG